MQIEVRWYGRIDAAQELAEFLGAVPRMTGADDGPGFYIQRREQRRGAVPDVIMGASGRQARPHRQQRRRAIQRLNLALLVHAEHQGAIRRMQIQPDDVAHFVDEQRILRQLERLGRCGCSANAFQMRATVD